MAQRYFEPIVVSNREMIMSRPLKTPLRQGLFFAVCFIGLAAFWAAPKASAKAGSLDQTFGVRGRAVTALDFGYPKYWESVQVHAERASDGRVVVAGNGQVIEYLPSGRLNRNFARDGLLRLESFEGQPFELSDLAIDSQGRIVMAGTAAYARRAVILRFRPNGIPDSEFGGGDGAVKTDFELPPPEHLVPGEDPTETGVSVAGVAVDPQDRIVVSGAAIEYFGYCLTTTKGYVARLTAEGILDPTFGSNGAVMYAATTSRLTENLTLDPSGAPLFSSEGYFCRHSQYDKGPTMYRLSLTGSSDQAFGESGEIPIAKPSQIAFDDSERIVTLTDEGSIFRYTPSGAPDADFSNDGVVHVGGSWIPGSFTVAPSGSVIVTGTGEGRHRGSKRKPRRWITLALVGSRGRLDMHFGNSGVVKASLGRRSSASGRAILMDGERHVIVAAAVRSRDLPTGQGLALFRFDLR